MNVLLPTQPRIDLVSNVPRASLCITLLDDEDYCVLVASKGGLEAFGVFVSMVILGRSRLQNGKARRSAESGLPSDNSKLKQLSEENSLTFDNSLTHLASLAHIDEKQLHRCLTTLKGIADRTGGHPWMYLDESKHLVIRSFFKFNTKSGWGGNREGAGRKSSGNQDGNQDDSEINHLDSNLQPTRIPSGTGIGIGTGTVSPLPPVPEPIEFINDPASVKRCAATADRLFPMLEFGLKVHRTENTINVDWFEVALSKTHAAGISGNGSWQYAVVVYQGIVAEGGPKKPGKQSRTSHRLEPAIPAHPVQETPADSKYRKNSASAFRERREKELEKQINGEAS